MRAFSLYISLGKGEILNPWVLGGEPWTLGVSDDSFALMGFYKLSIVIRCASFLSGNFYLPKILCEGNNVRDFVLLLMNNPYAFSVLFTFLW